ncbi:MAG: hypothetical protein A2015_03225 [Spirochaetes bacterium GWF1_31_7]|nr:MAG: hypothetical protein A2Y30_07310 [Spirochaetes bacterium GWE1_32_154]OHD50869.1 MAG: hypothetical protein A2015_03225 [Spirochaetes bacterium GWF1_31_7]OHD51873.1 MAG: hypothetical protein A2Y29_10500 [Spirochaetes bacterium GWE2_31_10]HBD96420.1 hypothetical protein [Spirochaetia bacterium]HBI38222.1 hypothetical protein [Spirochaetia bacterium]
MLYSLEISGSEEIVIIKYFEDNTADFMPSISFFDEIDYSFSSNEISFFFNEHESIATKPIFFTLIKTDNYANNIQILNALFTHTKILFTDIPSIKNTSFIDINYFSLNSIIEANPAYTYADTTFSFKPAKEITIGVPLLYANQKTTSGIGFQFKKKLIDLNHQLLLASPVSSFKPQVITSSYNRIDNFYFNGQMIISDQYLKNEFEIMYKNNFLFTGIHNNTSLYDYNKIYSFFAFSISLYIKNHTISLFSKTRSNLKYSFNHSSLFFQKNYYSGIDYTIQYNYFFISNTTGVTGEKNPLELTSDQFKPDVPFIILQTKGGYNNSYFLFSSEFNFLYSLNNTFEYSFLIAIKDLHFFNFTFDISNGLISNNFNYFIRFDNNVKISYRLNYFGIFYFDANLSTEFAQIFSNKIIFTIGSLFTF